jgi:hypothetical protein
LDVGSIPTASTNFIMIKLNNLKRIACAGSITFTLLMGYLIPLETSMAAEYPVDADPRTIEAPPKPYRWLTDPPVVVCKDSMVTQSQVRDAMAYWTERGHYFGKLMFHKNPDSVCTKDIPEGYIVVRPASALVLYEMKRDTLAETRFNTTAGGNHILYAKIFMVVPPKTRVLEHEFGHALGFLHYNVKGHLMHVKVTSGGWDDVGLRDMRRHAREQAAATLKDEE